MSPVSPHFHVIFSTSGSCCLNIMRTLCIIPSFIEISTWVHFILLIVWGIFFFTFSFFFSWEECHGNAFTQSHKHKIIINAYLLMYWLCFRDYSKCYVCINSFSEIRISNFVYIHVYASSWWGDHLRLLLDFQKNIEFQNDFKILISKVIWLAN